MTGWPVDVSRALIVQRASTLDVYVGAAAIADFTPRSVASEKIKKSEAGGSTTLELVRTRDVIASLVERPADAAEMGAAGRRFVERWASPAGVAEAYERLFAELAAT